MNACMVQKTFFITIQYGLNCVIYTVSNSKYIIQFGCDHTHKNLNISINIIIAWIKYIICT